MSAGRVAALALAVLLAAPAAAVVFEPREFASPGHEARYKSLIQELRCLVCQNQNIADSNAPLAQDLRREVYQMIGQGRDDGEIIDFMVARYGDFVLYRPPLKAATVALWAGPAVMAIIGLVVLARALARRRRDSVAGGALSDGERARLDALLAGGRSRSPERE